MTKAEAAKSTESAPDAPKERRGRGEKHGDLKTALLAAADRLLEESGPENLSFRAVARMAGVSQTAPYNHFASREALLAALAGRGFAELADRQAAVATEPEPRLALHRVGREYIRFACGQPKLYRQMFGAGSGDAGWHDNPTVAGAKTRSFEPVHSVIRRLLPAASRPESIEEAAIASWALVHGLSMMLIDGTMAARANTDADIDVIAHRSIAILLDGLGDD